MFTQQTIYALASLQDLTYKGNELQRQTSQEHCTNTRDLLLDGLARSQLKLVGAGVRVACIGALLEGLLKAKPDFVGTPFEQAIDEIIAGYVDGSPVAENHASVELSLLQRKASDWLKEQEEAALPLRKYAVPSAFDSDFATFTVEATSPQKARLVAAAQHYKCAVNELDGDSLRAFGNGELVDPE